MPNKGGPAPQPFGIVPRAPGAAEPLIFKLFHGPPEPPRPPKRERERERERESEIERERERE